VIGTSTLVPPMTLPTMPPRQLIFFPAIILALAGIGAMVAWPASLISWVIALGGLLVTCKCIRLAKRRYIASAEGLVRQDLWRRTDIRWKDVEAVGYQQITEGRGGIPVGIEFLIYSEQQTFRITLRHRDSDSFREQLTRESPQAMWIDERNGKISLGANSARGGRALELMHRHIAAFVAGMTLVFIPAVQWGIFDRHHGTTGRNAIVAAAFIYSILTIEHWIALWRLRKQPAGNDTGTGK
jgi:hypothetical protein